jgi:hypothetical protein
MRGGTESGASIPIPSDGRIGVAVTATSSAPCWLGRRKVCCSTLRRTVSGTKAGVPAPPIGPRQWRPRPTCWRGCQPRYRCMGTGIPRRARNPRPPRLSMWQTDIIYFGLDLADYIVRESGRTGARCGSMGAGGDHRVLARPGLKPDREPTPRDAAPCDDLAKIRRTARPLIVRGTVGVQVAGGSRRCSAADQRSPVDVATATSSYVTERL